MDSTRAITKRGDEEGQHELETDQKQIEKQPIKNGPRTLDSTQI